MLPSKPGVYMWLNTKKEILYVGKAKNLRARVISYFRSEGDGRPQLPWLMSKASDIDYIVTDSEMEALVTEANLVRAEKPRYNVRLKDDKRYPYIKITNEALPRIYLTRRILNDGARYLGPYTDVRAVRRTLELVHSIFPLRTCKNSLPSEKKMRACLNYQIKKCSGPCAGYIHSNDYNDYVQDAYRFILGKNNDLIVDLKKRMKAASNTLNFERASEIRDLIRDVQKVSERRKAFSTSLLTGDWDVINYHTIDNEACVVIMEIRDGNILGKKDYMMSGVKNSTPCEMLAEFLTQYYLHISWMPPEIHLPDLPEDSDTIAMLFSKHRHGRFSLVYPKRGEKARLLKMTAMNAETILKETLYKRDRRKNLIPESILSLEKDLRMNKNPRTIACIDISHLHGTDTVGSLVYFRDGKPDKKEYRRFKITTVNGIDDFASLKEVVRRYLKRRIEEKKELPDLFLIDGGKGQVSSVKSIIDEFGFQDQAIAGLAKRLEEVFLPNSSEAQNIPKTSPSIHLIQRIRDEAHRFAITYQKKLRKKRVISSSLDTIKGIGKKKRIDLIKHFGSVESLKKAAIKEIAETPGIGLKLALEIYKQLRTR